MCLSHFDCYLSINQSINQSIDQSKNTANRFLKIIWFKTSYLHIFLCVWTDSFTIYVRSDSLRYVDEPYIAENIVVPASEDGIILRSLVFTVRLHVMQRTVLLSEFCLSVCPSVRCVYCEKTKQRTANILIPHETAITLVFWHQQWLVGDAPFPLKSAVKVTHPPSKNADFDRFPLITSQP